MTVVTFISTAQGFMFIRKARNQLIFLWKIYTPLDNFLPHY